jgi:hypothetical protein
MRADPNPKPIIIIVLAGNRAIVSRNTNQPRAVIEFLDAPIASRDARIFREPFKSILRRVTDGQRQFMIQPPEIGCPTGSHFLSRRVLSFNGRKLAGFSPCSASSLSSSDQKAARGVASAGISSSHPPEIPWGKAWECPEPTADDPLLAIWQWLLRFPVTISLVKQCNSRGKAVNDTGKQKRGWNCFQPRL